LVERSVIAAAAGPAGRQRAAAAGRRRRRPGRAPGGRGGRGRPGSGGVRAAAAGFQVAPDEREKLQATGTLRFSKGKFQLDIILASLPFEDDARARARKHRLFGRLVPLPTPEDLILFKVLAGRGKDLVDAVGVARRHLPALDRGYLRAVLEAVCELAEDLAPLRRLDEVLRKASSGPG
jgi:hypothetical protein